MNSYHPRSGGRHMSRRNYLPLLMLICGLSLIGAGCSTDDTSSPALVGNPQGGDMTLNDNQARTFTTTTLDMLNELVNAVPDLAVRDFANWNMAKSPSDSVEWDPEQQAYTFAFEGPVLGLDPPNTLSMSVGIWVQFRDVGGEPLQLPLGATEMEVDYTTGMDVHMVEGQVVADMDYDTATNLTVSYLDGGDTYGVVGTGASSVAIAQISTQGSSTAQFALAWEVDLTATVDGCPSGTATITVQDYRLNAVYDGLGGVAWTLLGGSSQASGSGYLACAAP